MIGQIRERCMESNQTRQVLTVIIPCYNEILHIEPLVQKVLESRIQNKEIIIVDDCSTDGTRELLQQKIEPLVSQVIYLEKNSGKGFALRTGIQAATGDVVIIQDADLEYDPAEYPQVVLPIFDGTADVVYGSRFLKGSDFSGYWQNRLANRTLTFLSNCLTGLHITDMETCYKAFRRDLIQKVDLVENRFGFEPEVTAKIARLGCRIQEVPISYHPRTIKEGKKIGVKDGVRALYCILRYR